jgi:hydroxypyruvate isomerase
MTELKFDANLKWLFTEVDFLQRFDAAAAAGFAGVEYAAPYPYKATDLKRRLTDAGLQQVLINSPTGQPGTPERQGIACMPDKVKQFHADFELALEYAVELESDFIHVMAGIRQEGVSRDRAFARLVSNIIWASEKAKDTNVRILVEAQNKRDAPGFILETQAHAAAVAESVNSDNVGIMFDVYHAQIDEGDLVPKLQAMLPDIFHLQVADPPGRHEPGTGETNFRTIFDTISASDYTGWIGCEYEPRDDTVEGLTWIEELAR